jgi:hypothetical protein
LGFVKFNYAFWGFVKMAQNIIYAKWSIFGRAISIGFIGPAKPHRGHLGGYGCSKSGDMYSIYHPWWPPGNTPKVETVKILLRRADSPTQKYFDSPILNQKA